MPILKGKGGEFEALSHMARSTASSVTPLIEAVPKSGATELDVSWFVHEIRTVWPLSEMVVIDLCYLGTAGQPALWEEVLSEARHYQAKVVPAVHFDDEASVVELLGRALAVDRRGCCLRIDAADLGEDPQDLAIWAADLLSELRIEPDDADLVLDFGALSDDQTVSNAIERAIEHLERLPRLEQWRSVVVAGGAFPENLSRVESWSLTPLPRREADLWAGLASRKNFFRQQPIFGDYGVAYPPHTRPVRANPPPNIRYAVDGHWIVLRGRKNDPRGNEQYREICRIMSQLPDFGGAGLSWGDACIAKVVANEIGPGNPKKWRAYGTSHHLEYVTSRLASLGAP